DLQAEESGELFIHPRYQAFAVYPQHRVSVVEFFQHAVQLAANSLVLADTEDLGDLVSRQAKQAHLAGTLEDLVNGEIAPEDEIAAVLDLIQRVVALQGDGGPVLVGELRAQDQGPVIQALADDLGAEASGRRRQCLWIVRPQEGLITFPDADTLALEFPCDEVRTVDGGRGLERKEGAGAHYHGAEHFVADVDVVMRVAGAVHSEAAVIGLVSGMSRACPTCGG